MKLRVVMGIFVAVSSVLCVNHLFLCSGRREIGLECSRCFVLFTAGTSWLEFDALIDGFEVLPRWKMFGDSSIPIQVAVPLTFYPKISWEIITCNLWVMRLATICQTNLQWQKRDRGSGPNSSANSTLDQVVIPETHLQFRVWLFPEHGYYGSFAQQIFLRTLRIQNPNNSSLQSDISIQFAQ